MMSSILAVNLIILDSFSLSKHEILGTELS